MLISVGYLGRVVGIDFPGFALVVAFSILGMIDLLMPSIRLRVPRVLRPVRSWELRGRVYRVLGVRCFGRFLRESPLRFLNRRVYLKSFPRDVERVRTHVEDAEAAHFWGGLATVPYIAYAGSRGLWGSVAALILFNVFVNVYPILHLRWVRARMERFVESRRAGDSRCPQPPKEPPKESDQATNPVVSGKPQRILKL